jgi:uncharacterized lipoprotein YmbA
MKTRNRIFLFVALGAVLASSGCVKLWRESLDLKTYMIEAVREASTRETPLADKLWIETVHVLPPYNVRNLIVRENDVQYDTSYYSELILSPAENLRNNLFTWFSSSGVFGEVSANDRRDMSHRLVVTLLKLHADKTSGDGVGVVALKVTLIDERTKGMNILFSKEYVGQEPVGDLTSDELIRTYNAALSGILSECERDMIGVLQ